MDCLAGNGGASEVGARQVHRLEQLQRAADLGRLEERADQTEQPAGDLFPTECKLDREKVINNNHNTIEINVTRVLTGLKRRIPTCYPRWSCTRTCSRDHYGNCARSARSP